MLTTYKYKIFLNRSALNKIWIGRIHRKKPYDIIYKLIIIKNYEQLLLQGDRIKTIDAKV